MKRIGSNLRPAEQKPQRKLRNIIRYSDEVEASNDYPRRIFSPTRRHVSSSSITHGPAMMKSGPPPPTLSSPT